MREKRSYCRHEWVERTCDNDPHGVVPLSHCFRGSKPPRTRIFECLKCGWVKSKYIYPRKQNENKDAVAARMVRVRLFREMLSER
jgi:hypothetical protein